MNLHSIKSIGTVLVSALLIALAGCTAPATNEPAGATLDPPDAPVTEAAPPALTAPEASPPRPAPPMSDPLPPLQAPEPASPRASLPGGQTVRIDTSCTRDADCTIKNVGNCCGEYPACVNVDSPTDPAGVQAECARKGMASVCGFPAITSCQCVAGECQGSNAAVAQ